MLFKETLVGRLGINADPSFTAQTPSQESLESLFPNSQPQAYPNRFPKEIQITKNLNFVHNAYQVINLGMHRSYGTKFFSGSMKCRSGSRVAGSILEIPNITS